MPGAGPEGDMVGDGCRLQGPQRARLFAVGIRLGQVGLAPVLEQHAPAREHLHQTGDDGLQQYVHLVIGGRARLDELRHALGTTPVHTVQQQAMKMYVEVGRGAEALYQRDRAGVAFVSLEPGSLQQMARNHGLHVACLLLPVAALLLAGARPTLLTLQQPRRTDVRASLHGALLMGTLAPLVAGMKVLPIATVLPLVASALVIGALATAWTLAADPTVREKETVFASVAFVLMLYGGALAVWLNHALPPLKTESTLVTVTGMRVYSTRAGPTFLLRTDPGGTLADWREMDVERSV
jgi:hypothetical protein